MTNSVVAFTRGVAIVAWIEDMNATLLLLLLLFGLVASELSGAVMFGEGEGEVDLFPVFFL